MTRPTDTAPTTVAAEAAGRHRAANAAGDARPAKGDLLTVDDVHVRFHTRNGVVHAVEGVSLTLREGEVLAVVGESGSGKTVFTRRVMGLISGSRETDVEGTVTFDGITLSDLDAKGLAGVWGKEIALVLQDPMTSLNPVKRIGAQITETLVLHHKLSKQDANARAVELLRSVGLSEPERRVRQYPHELSGGMRQRVTIAIALSCSPRLLLADEPTTALDVTVQAQILDLLGDLQSRLGMAMLLVTHDLRVVRSRSDRIAVMYAGRIVETAPTKDLFDAPRMPYTEALMNAVPPITGPNHVRLAVIPGRPPNLLSPPSGCRFSPRCPYAQDRCLTEEPPLRPASELPGGGIEGHSYRCWYPVGTPENAEARRRNVERGETAAGTPVTGEMVPA
ncbi:ABC transporter ATP-binding protein [Pseudonocardia benzenivorans]|uniref:Oligopeptide/dipeptide ABC transporter, ATPase subunit n=2 Tax=Pseudonocardia TaxID=1847 RepID=F4CJK3_PSEUX|nr:ABC transporter ATP-binding protein [Pseudonocardia dioxanivorans]AEA25863.1 oligopeptide/dipeptide ABC transporter, ATPase subunit [Pseudonocardia dioxanivorans CB1190]GJF06377.1 ABC transporter ATP-binding protein [Pseudonocardia sp. D17]